jgi:hypothetical protein
MNDETGQSISRRFPMSYGLRYVMMPPAAARTAVGETVWISRREVAFLAKGPACVGDKVQMFIEWPVLLHGEVPLQLTLSAEIVQSSGPLSVARLTKHEFRTRGIQCSSMGAGHRPALPSPPPYPARRMPYPETIVVASQPWQDGLRPASAAGG